MMIFRFLLILILTGCASKNIVKRDFSTPEATFETWKGAAKELDLKLLVDSYALSARPSIESELARTTEEALQSMKKETQKTQFVIEKVVYEDNLAYLRIRRSIQKNKSIEVVTMIKEGDSWKLLP